MGVILGGDIYAWQHAPWAPLASWEPYSHVPPKWRLFIILNTNRSQFPTHGMWVSIASEASCAAALQQTVGNYGIFDTASLQAVLLFDAAGFARALCTALQVEPPAAQQSTATDEKVLMVDAASQTTEPR